MPISEALRYSCALFAFLFMFAVAVKNLVGFVRSKEDPDPFHITFMAFLAGFSMVMANFTILKVMAEQLT